MSIFILFGKKITRRQRKADNASIKALNAIEKGVVGIRTDNGPTITICKPNIRPNIIYRP